MKKKVYVVNKGGHDFSSAEYFGKIEYLSEGSLNKYAVTNMYRVFSSKLRDSQPNDYILLTGLTTMCSIACSIFAFMHGKLNILLFKGNRYVERSIVLGELLTKTPYTELELQEEKKRIDNVVDQTGLTTEQLEQALKRKRRTNGKKSN